MAAPRGLHFCVPCVQATHPPSVLHPPSFLHPPLPPDSTPSAPSGQTGRLPRPLSTLPLTRWAVLHRDLQAPHPDSARRPSLPPSATHQPLQEQDGVFRRRPSPPLPPSHHSCCAGRASDSSPRRLRRPAGLAGLAGRVHVPRQALAAGPSDFPFSQGNPWSLELRVRCVRGVVCLACQIIRADTWNDLAAAAQSRSDPHRLVQVLRKSGANQLPMARQRGARCRTRLLFEW